MTLGEKIYRARKEQKLTQTALAGSFITRNMLSKIENGSAKPSLETLEYISGRLKMPVGYFLSPDDDHSKYQRESAIPSILSACRAGDYKRAYDIAVSMGDISGDSILCSIAAGCAYRAAYSCYESGNSSESGKFLDRAREYSAYALIPSAPSKYETDTLDILLGGDGSVGNLHQSRLLFMKCRADSPDILTLLVYPYDLLYRGRMLMAEEKYYDAIELIITAAEDKTLFACDRIIACEMLEKCYVNTGDYEHAYKISAEKQKTQK